MQARTGRLGELRAPAEHDGSQRRGMRAACPASRHPIGPDPALPSASKTKGGAEAQDVRDAPNGARSARGVHASAQATGRGGCIAAVHRRARRRAHRLSCCLSSTRPDTQGKSGSATGRRARAALRMRVAVKVGRNQPPRVDAETDKPAQEEDFHQTPRDSPLLGPAI
jgi:hypothetical protein